MKAAVDYVNGVAAMKPLVRLSLVALLCFAFSGCGVSKTRIWRGPRVRSSMSGASGSIYSPPVEPESNYAPMPEPQPREVAPPRPADFPATPTPALELEEELPPPPAENEESVQFILPVPPSRMPNALDPPTSKPMLEQSSAVRPLRREEGETIGEGKIASIMPGHSTFATSESNRPARLLRIEADEPSTELMQVQYVPLLVPAPAPAVK